jgi:CheY-like chemotaxis protein
MKKRKLLFSKFEKSLDSLNQGTEIGLSVCESLVDLVEGEITLDEKYESGMEGCPGSRFVVKLDTAAIMLDSIDLEKSDSFKDDSSLTKIDNLPMDRKISAGDSLPGVLPENLSVLFMDDDKLLRKLFSRSIRKLMPSWKVEVAHNGETSLRLVDKVTFDLIFMDQYMTSADKQLLGTETVRELRAKGVKSRICGLSANNVEKSFLQSGANHFLIKPFQCAKVPLMRLLRILYDNGDQGRIHFSTCATCVPQQLAKLVWRALNSVRGNFTLPYVFLQSFLAIPFRYPSTKRKQTEWWLHSPARMHDAGVQERHLKLKQALRPPKADLSLTGSGTRSARQ